MNPIMRIAIALSILLSGLALVPMALAQNETFAWQKFADGYECSENCTFVTNITFEVTPLEDGKFLVEGIVTVVGEDGNPVQNAIVSGKWTKPNGVTYSTRENTGEDGTATFQTISREGQFTLSINNVFHNTLVFDPAGSMLSNSIIVP